VIASWASKIADLRILEESVVTGGIHGGKKKRIPTSERVRRQPNRPVLRTGAAAGRGRFTRGGKGMCSDDLQLPKSGRNAQEDKANFGA